MSWVVMMCGLAASGKTTTAGRLHAALGGVLIRSCDVYQDLGISLPDWVRRTRGLTVDVAAYDRERDHAYEVMARRLDAALDRGAMVILDAVHGEKAKREVVYRVCRTHGATPVLLLCRCDDLAEVARRFHARGGRDSEPEHEASHLSVFRDIARRWEDPATDRVWDGAQPTMVMYDSLRGQLTPSDAPDRGLFEEIYRALGRRA